MTGWSREAFLARPMRSASACVASAENAMGRLLHLGVIVVVVRGLLRVYGNERVKAIVPTDGEEPVVAVVHTPDDKQDDDTKRSNAAGGIFLRDRSHLLHAVGRGVGPVGRRVGPVLHGARDGPSGRLGIRVEAREASPARAILTAKNKQKKCEE